MLHSLVQYCCPMGLAVLRPATPSVDAASGCSRWPATAAQLTYLPDLPDEVWFEVLARLPGKDLARTLLVQRAFGKMSELIWRRACEVQFSHVMPQPIQRSSDDDVEMVHADSPARGEAPAWPSQAGVKPPEWPTRFYMLSLRAAEFDSRAISGNEVRSEPAQGIGNFSRAILVDFLLDVRLCHLVGAGLCTGRLQGRGRQMHSAASSCYF